MSVPLVQLPFEHHSFHYENYKNKLFTYASWLCLFVSLVATIVAPTNIAARVLLHEISFFLVSKFH